MVANLSNSARFMSRTDLLTLTMAFLCLTLVIETQTTCTFTVTPDRLEFDAAEGMMGVKVVASGVCE